MEINTINNAVNAEEEEMFKLVFNAAIAKSLLEDYGHPIVGLKANKSDPARSVFVFRETVKFHRDMQEIIKKRRAARKAQNEEEIKEAPQQED